MFRPNTPESNVSDLFYVEQSFNDPSLPRPNTPTFLISTEMSSNKTRETISISSTASLRPQIATADSDSNEPTMPYGFRWQLPYTPPSLNDLNLPPNPFNILATMAVANPTADEHDENYSPQLRELWKPSPILTLPMNHSIIEG